MTHTRHENRVNTSSRRPLLNAITSWNSNRRIEKKVFSQTRKNAITERISGKKTECMESMGLENVDSLDDDGSKEGNSQSSGWKSNQQDYLKIKNSFILFIKSR